MTPEQFRRLEEIFDTAVELRGEERASYLDRATAGDAGLRGEVDDLLRSDTEGRGRVGSIIQGVAGNDSFAGRRVGPYRVLREIGRGGMGVVYEAERDGEFTQKVALKVSTLAVFSADSLERFRQERQILAGLTHPFIARLIDGGSTNDGVPYLAMELVEGISIRDYVNREQLTPEANCRLFLKVCDAVEYAHQNLIVHRDLKPANILVDDRGDPKLLDFGVAKLLEAGREMTATRFGPATPDYSAPEQVLGHSITTRTDVYQLGLIFYELLSGKRAQSVEDTSLSALQRAVCEGEVAPLEMGGDLATIVATALQRDTTRRYASVGALAADIRAWLAGQPIAAQRDSAWHLARKFVRRNWLLVGAAALLLVTLLGGAAATLYQARRAERRFVQVRGIAKALLYDVHDSIQRLPASIEAQQVVIRTALQYLDGLASEVKGDQTLQLEVAAGYNRIGAIQSEMLGQSLGEREAGVASLRKALGILEPMNAAAPTEVEIAVELSDTYSQLAAISFRSIQSADARQLAERAIAVMRPPVERRPANVLARRRLAMAYVLYNRDLNGRESTNLEYIVRPVTELEAVMRMAPSDKGVMNELAHAYLAAGTVYFNAKNGKAARPYFEKAVALREKTFAVEPGSGPGQRSLMLAYASLGDVHWGFAQSLGNREIAIQNYEKMALAAKALRDKDPESKNTRLDYAMSQMRYAGALAPEDAKAIALLEESLRTLETIAAEDTGNAALRRRLVEVSLRLGQRQAGLQQLGKAAATLERASAICEAMAKADPTASGWKTNGIRTYLQLGPVYEKSGRTAESVSLLAKAKRLLAEAQKLDSETSATMAKSIAEWEARLR